MSESKHAQGPWRWSRTYEMGSGRLYWCLENDQSAAEGKTIDGSLLLQLCEDVYCGQRFLDNPNARLIAAAPDLLEALEELNKHIDFSVPCGDAAGDFEVSDASGLNAAFALALAAIAKAKGE